jgi:hypothetical protein
MRRIGFILVSSVCAFAIGCIASASENARAGWEKLPRDSFPALTLSRDFQSDAGVAPALQGDGGAIADGGVIAEAGNIPDAGNIENAATVVASMRRGFRACYQAALDRYPDFSAAVRLSMRVRTDGSIVRVTGVGTNAPSELIECLFDEVGRHRFEPPEGGAAVVNVPVNLISLAPHAPQ